MRNSIQRSVALVALLSAACQPEVSWRDPTQAVVSLDSNLGASVASIDVAVFDGQEQVLGDSHRITLSADRPLPLLLTVFPKSAKNDFLVVAKGINGAGEAIIETKVLGTFVRNRTVEVALRLVRECLGVPCTKGSTCIPQPAPACAATPLAPVSYVEFSGSATAAGASTDGGNTIIYVYPDGGSTLISGMDAGVSTQGSDGGTAFTGGPDADAMSSTGMQPAMTGNAEAGAPVTGNPDPGNTDAGPTLPLTECDATRPCSPGSVCSTNTCVSACTQTQCNPNATCSLTNNAPVCTCDRGYVGSGSGTAVTCVRDVTCEQLNCDTNATCTGTAPNLTCVCKSGYSGDGKTCAPVSCPAPSIDNGTVTTTNGNLLASTATYRCNTGYTQGTGTWSRTCGTNMLWSGTAPTCNQITCLPLSNPANGLVSAAQGRELGDIATYSCNAGYKLQGSTSRTCQQSGWSSTAPTCAAACGDGTVDTALGEQCDNGGANPWTCTSTCTSKSTYTACSAAGGCLNGESCTPYGCSPACTAASSCPLLPSSSRLTRECRSSYCSAGGCVSNAECAPGLVCLTSEGMSVCSSCIVSASPSLCSGGTTCVSPNGTNLGFCR